MVHIVKLEKHNQVQGSIINKLDVFKHWVKIKTIKTNKDIISIQLKTLNYVTKTVNLKYIRKLIHQKNKKKNVCLVKYLETFFLIMGCPATVLKN